MRAVVPYVADGTAIAAFALTEPEAGSDVSAMSLQATPDGDGYRLRGDKLWISNAPRGRRLHRVRPHLVPRGPPRADRVRGRGRQSGADGRAQGDAERRMRSAALRFEHVYVFARRLRAWGAGRRLPGGDADARPVQAQRGRIRDRDGPRHALELAADWALERQTRFGKPLKDHQAVAHRIADLTARGCTAARLLVRAAAEAHDEGRPDPALAAMAKLLATETAQEAVDAAVQFHGARALEQGHPLEHLYREVRAPRIYEGASEIQREIIARALYRSGRGST